MIPGNMPVTLISRLTPLLLLYVPPAGWRNGGREIYTRMYKMYGFGKIQAVSSWDIPTYSSNYNPLCSCIYVRYILKVDNLQLLFVELLLYQNSFDIIISEIWRRFLWTCLFQQNLFK